ncbi:MAG: hypothetical protein K6E55_06250 [Thermoguttaceae bacterium]|nr:hypothetical protein [Thermoguttaceae bacterium]
MTAITIDPVFPPARGNNSSGSFGAPNEARPAPDSYISAARKSPAAARGQVYEA